MICKSTNLQDCYLIEPKVYSDERGYFYESFHSERYKKITNQKYDFNQDNISFSKKNVLRGLHFQITKPQAKLVSVLKGEVYDVAVDLRADSPSYGNWFGVYLSEKNKLQMLIPEGFAHGFLVTSDTAIFSYKCSNFYDPNDEGSIIWNDKILKIDWPSSNPIISKKDQKANSFIDHKK